MPGTSDLIDALKAELKAARVTYADLAQAIAMSESSVKRMFSQRNMTLARIDDICRVLKVDFADLARRVADAQPAVDTLTQEQEKAIMADMKILLVGTCCLSQWTFEQMLSTYDLKEVEIVRALTALDRLGVIELKPMNRYRLKLSRTFRWRPNGPVMNYFRSHVLPDYFRGHFELAGETLMLVHGNIARAAAPLLADKINRLAQEFAQQHLADQKLSANQRDGYTLILAMRSWEHAAFSKFRRKS